MSAAPSLPAKAKGRRATWCGPYALALMAGTSYEKAYEACLGATRKSFVKGITISQTEAAARLLGAFRLDFWRTPPCTLRRMADHLKPRRLYIINVTGHFVVVNTTDWTVADNQTLEWQPIETSKHARKRAIWAAEALPPRTRRAAA